MDAKKRGRPQLTDPRRVSRVALRLFERRGLDVVTMDDVAEAAGISRRTLFRMFPSKADLVWEGLDLVVAQTRAQMLAPDASLSLRALVNSALLPGVQFMQDPALEKLARRRLRLVARHPALLAHAPLQALQQSLADAIAQRLRPTATPPQLIAASVVSVAMSALLWWAREGVDSAPHTVLQQAFSALRDVDLEAPHVGCCANGDPETDAD
jgi:AcrR family transcriptional regulator